MTYLLRRNSDGKFVTAPGAWHSYTLLLEEAKTFSTREAAEKDRCSNESIVALADLTDNPFPSPQSVRDIHGDTP